MEEEQTKERPDTPVRVTNDIYRHASLVATALGKSLKQFTNEALQEKIDNAPVTVTVHQTASLSN